MKNLIEKLRKYASETTLAEVIEAGEREKGTAADFDPDSIGIANGNFFGLPCSGEDAETVLIQVPWDATASYGKGTAEGPAAMLAASLQVDLFDERYPDVAGMKVWTLPQEDSIAELNAWAGKISAMVVSALEQGADPAALTGLCRQVDAASEAVNSYVESTAEEYLSQGKKVAVVGGEHSVPLGLIKALARRFPGMGVLHIDAHSDTREAYEGFRYSHASIMYNVMKEVPGVSRIVQAGIRDFCSAEHALTSSSDRFVTFTDFYLKDSLYSGSTWKELCDRIIEALPQNVYISFDIDGLSPEYCPGTGTPVPGGLSFSQADWLLYRLAVSGRRIVGFDLCEVAPGAGEWDANSGVRMLFRLLAAMTFSIREK